MFDFEGNCATVAAIAGTLALPSLPDSFETQEIVLSYACWNMIYATEFPHLQGDVALSRGVSTVSLMFWLISDHVCAAPIHNSVFFLL